MNINWGLFPEPETAAVRTKTDRGERKEAKIAAAQAGLSRWLGGITFL
jgi:hypothetical protein